MQAYIAPPVAACFLLGIVSPRLNGAGALTALLVGFVLGALRLVLELAKAHLPPGSMWAWFAGINFLHFAALLFVLCAVLLVVVSLATPPPPADRVADLSYATAKHDADSQTSSGQGGGAASVALSITLAAVVGALWFVFR